MATYIPQYHDGVQIRYEDKISWIERTSEGLKKTFEVKAILIKRAFFEGQRLLRLSRSGTNVYLDSYLLGGVTIPDDGTVNLVAPEGFLENFLEQEFDGTTFDDFIEDYTIEEALHGLAHFVNANPVARWDNLFGLLASQAAAHLDLENGMTVTTKSPQGDSTVATISSAVNISTFRNCVRTIWAAFTSDRQLANLPVKRLCSNDTLEGTERRLGFGLYTYIEGTENLNDIYFYVWF